MKIDRQMAILTILLGREQVTAPDLAHRLEVSRRTITRDIEDLCRAGIPLVTRQGAGGGISIQEGYKLDQSLLSEAEREMLLAALEGLATVSEGNGARTLEEKLGAVEEGGRLRVDLVSYYRDSLPRKILLLREAVRKNKVVEFTYYSPSGRSVRRLEPAFVAYRWSGWYVYGYCLRRGAFRLFKLNRLWELSVTGESFIPREIPPEAQDLNAFQRGGTPVEILFHPEVEHLVVEEYGPGSYTPREDGWLHFAWPFAQRENLLRWVLGFGDRARVLGPPEIREEVRERLQRAAAQYKD